MSTETEQLHLNTGQVAQELQERGISSSTSDVARLAREGAFPNAQMIRGRWQIPPRDVADYVVHNSPSSPPNEGVSLYPSQVAKQLNIEIAKVVELCLYDYFPGAYRTYENGPWRIPPEAVSHLIGRGIPLFEIPTTWDRVSYRIRKSQSRIFTALLIPVIVVLLAAISAGADYPRFKEQLVKLGIVPEPLSFPVASDGEVLVIVAAFHRSEGVVDTEPHNEIRLAIDQAADELLLPNVRVEIEPTQLHGDERERAEALGERYNAGIVIWGADTGVRVSVYFLTLAQLDINPLYREITELERTQVADPEEYSRFVVEDLPNAMRFLSLFAIGQAFAGQGNLGKAAAALELATSEAKGFEKMEGDVADAYFNYGVYSEAANMFEGEPFESANVLYAYSKAIELEPDFASAYHNRGGIRLEMGDLEAAFEDFSRAIEHGLALSYAGRGYVRLEQGDTSGASRDFDSGVKFASGESLGMALGVRGNIRLSEGDTGAAIKDYSQAIGVLPDFPVWYVMRGQAYVELGDVDAALEDYSRGLELAKGGQALFLAMVYASRAFAFALSDQLDSAVQDYEEAIVLEPQNPEYWLQLGILKILQGHRESALEDLKRAMELDPGQLQAVHYHGVAYYLMGMYEEAVRDFNAVLAMDPMFAPSLVGLAMSHYSLGEEAQALGSLDRAYSADPELPPAVCIEMGRRMRCYLDERSGTLIVQLQRWKYLVAFADLGLAHDANQGGLEQALLLSLRGMGYSIGGMSKEAIGDLTQAISLFEAEGEARLPTEVRESYIVSFLFRADSYMEINSEQLAVADYRRFLELAPTSSKRGYVEGRIMLLDDQVILTPAH